MIHTPPAFLPQSVAMHSDKLTRPSKNTRVCLKTRSLALSARSFRGGSGLVNDNICGMHCVKHLSRCQRYLLLITAPQPPKPKAIRTDGPEDHYNVVPVLEEMSPRTRSYCRCRKHRAAVAITLVEIVSGQGQSWTRVWNPYARRTHIS